MMLKNAQAPWRCEDTFLLEQESPKFLLGAHEPHAPEPNRPELEFLFVNDSNVIQVERSVSAAFAF